LAEERMTVLVAALPPWAEQDVVPVPLLPRVVNVESGDETTLFASSEEVTMKWYVVPGIRSVSGTWCIVDRPYKGVVDPKLEVSPY
jgi:hypothetical protein